MITGRRIIGEFTDDHQIYANVLHCMLINGTLSSGAFEEETCTVSQIFDRPQKVSPLFLFLF